MPEIGTFSRAQPIVSFWFRADERLVDGTGDPATQTGEAVVELSSLHSREFYSVYAKGVHLMIDSRYQELMPTGSGSYGIVYSAVDTVFEFGMWSFAGHSKESRHQDHPHV